MSESPQHLRSGTFSAGKKPLPFTMEDFREWTLQDMDDPITLNLLAWFIVERALGDAVRRKNKSGFNYLETSQGLTVSVFAVQDRSEIENRRIPNLSFDVPNHFPWDFNTVYDLDSEALPADVYVFAVFRSEHNSLVESKDLDRWTFYVLGFKLLSGWSSVIRKVSLFSVRASGALKADFRSLPHEILEADAMQSDGFDEDEESEIQP